MLDLMLSSAMAVAQSAASASPMSWPAEVFTCADHDAPGKTLWLTAEGETLVYHFGARSNEELTIIGRPASGNIHYRGRDKMEEGHRFADAQVRFSQGPYSYIVVWDIHSRPPYPKGAHFLVIKGLHTLKVTTCSSFHVDPSYPFGRLPTDRDAYEHDQF
jgi:hypothetical protein